VVVEEGDGSGEVFVCYNEGFRGGKRVRRGVLIVQA
jgi:hypothetical protein